MKKFLFALLLISISIQGFSIPLDATIYGSESINYEVTNLATYSTEPGFIDYRWTIVGGSLHNSTGYTNNIEIYWETEGDNSVSVSYMDSDDGTMYYKLLKVNCFSEVLPLPIPKISGSLNINKSKFRRYKYVTETDFLNYVWTVDGVTINRLEAWDNYMLDVVFDTPGEHKITVNYSNQSEIFAITPTEITVIVNDIDYTLPIPTIIGELNPIIGESYEYYTESTTLLHEFNWSYVGGENMNNISNGIGSEYGNYFNGCDTKVVVKWTELGEQSISVNYCNDEGEFALIPTQLKVNVKPKINTHISDIEGFEDYLSINNDNIIISSTIPNNTILRLYDIYGKIIMNKLVVSDEYISLGDLTKGIYIANIKDTNIKFIKQ